MVLNHDYFIANRGFFFDLGESTLILLLFFFCSCLICFTDPWPNVAPNDDPKQPPGTDYDTLIMMLEKAASSGGHLIHVGGFPPWAFKYITNQHQGNRVAVCSRYL